MDYLKIYKKLITNAIERTISDNEVYEKHHIISKCIFNDNYSISVFNDYYKLVKSKYSLSNVVKLTLREHYISHLLLVRIFEKNKNCHFKLLCAANFLTNRTKNNREYEWQKKEYIEKLKISMTGKPSRAKGKKWSEESKKNKSGTNHYMYNKNYDELYGLEKSQELKENRRNSQLGRIKSTEEKNKLSNRIFTEEWKNNISKNKKGKKLSETNKDNIKKFMLNPDLNPNVDQTLYKFYHIDGREIISKKIIIVQTYTK